MSPNNSLSNHSLQRPKIKICRVQDIHVARYLAKKGVNFIGLHAVFEKPKKKILSQYNDILREIKKYYPLTKTVLVTRIENLEKLVDTYLAMPTDFIQISAPLQKSEKEILLNNLKKKGFIPQIMDVVSAEESDALNIQQSLIGETIVLDKDFGGGTGIEIEKLKINTLLKNIKTKTVLLAGGISPENIKEKIKSFPDIGFDIQSALEIPNSNYKKDIHKINQLFSILNNENNLEPPHKENSVSFSLQNQELFGKKLDLNTSIIDCIHADFSDESMVPGWEIDCLSSIKHWGETNPFIPLEVHIFSRNVRNINNYLNQCKKLHPNFELCYFHIEEQTDINNFLKIRLEFPSINFKPSVNYNTDISIEGILKGPHQELLISFPGDTNLTDTQFTESVSSLLDKIKKITPNFHLSADRNLNLNRIKLLRKTGFTKFVVGRSLYDTDNISDFLYNIDSEHP